MIEPIDQPSRLCRCMVGSELEDVILESGLPGVLAICSAIHSSLTPFRAAGLMLEATPDMQHCRPPVRLATNRLVLHACLSTQ